MFFRIVEFRVNDIYIFIYELVLQKYIGIILLIMIIIVIIIIIIIIMIIVIIIISLFCTPHERLS